MKKWLKVEGREKRHKRIRKKIIGTKERPRLSIRRSINHLYAQIIDDTAAKTLISLSTLSPDLRGKLAKSAGNVKGASLLGAVLAEKCKKESITKVVFDRAGYLYHGRVKALADAARKGGLSF
ncbi:MAG: 50S ribosomal protein L18 [Omnitrophica bacterium RIFCSPLOWO2_02_FULL_45_16]|nr:MAG: 50S ribosomal protein L18 [Omnitrophica bacterium RIFCSPHIGHO2_02_FULL_46_20]OGW92562.1 MAG: 50S ribosomal protein L18 [Omnitrophica bacterium RIFCSPLOWO2_12_FULL_45_13]OGW93177.1 MAG: 50S ribosomal protein L18 [Omnitrophica bacterium RIFCSPLOWO2_01_FULL_45_24]OGX00143.1 MAG: 50S ribosomal protein L18 [Omnitrophica bacterium RIFCSPLOWO2_02_FULL_45_16]